MGGDDGDRTLDISLSRVPQLHLSQLATAPRGGPTVVAGMALPTLGVSVWNFKRQLPRGSMDIGPVLAAALGISLSLVLLYLAVRLVQSELPPRQRWWVAGGTLGGAVLAGALIFLTGAIRLAEGESVGNPLFVLVMNTTAGAIAGTLVGNLYALESKQAERATRARQHLAFINSVINHDVRNGVAVIRARAELLDDEDNEGVSAILEQSETIEGLIDRTEAIITALDEGEGIAVKPMSLAAELRPRLDAIDASFPDTSLAYDVPADVAVEANELLADVVGNLVTNAIEHNDSDAPTVEVNVEVAAETVAISVADDGPGMPSAIRRQLEDGSNRTETGGFGLFFVRTMVQEYGGDISVSDNDPRGTVVTVRLERA